MVIEQNGVLLGVPVVQEVPAASKSAPCTHRRYTDSGFGCALSMPGCPCAKYRKRMFYEQSGTAVSVSSAPIVQGKHGSGEVNMRGQYNPAGAGTADTRYKKCGAC